MMSGNNSKKKLIQTKLSFSSSGSSVSQSSSSSTNCVPTGGLKRKFNTMRNDDGNDLDAESEACHKKNSKQASGKKEGGEYVVSAATSDVSGNPTTAHDDYSDDGSGRVGVHNTTNADDDHSKKADRRVWVDNAADEDNIHSKDVTGKRGTQKSTSQPLLSGCSSESDSEYVEDTHHDKDTIHQHRQNDRQRWRGAPIQEMKVSHKCRATLGALEQTDDHSVFVKCPFHYKEDALPAPFPAQCHDKWDGFHVRMPFSEQNEYPRDDKNGGMQLAKRWDMIKTALKKEISGSFELQEAILSYNKRYSNKWNFTAFHYFFNKVLSEEERKEFFDVMLKLLVELALSFPDLCTKPIPLLRAGKNKKLTFSQQQVACLLANAFFCTFPRRNTQAKGTEYASYPDINFNNLYHCEHHSPSMTRKVQKLKCIVHYFRRVLTDMPRGLVTFHRKVEREHDWNEDQEMLTNLHVSSAGTIEDDGKGMLQVDFANKYIGGGVLGHGCVQEEIRFLICPEMIVARLFTEVLGPLECLIMTGCEQFSRYEGYADTFRWAEDFVDRTPRDTWGRLFTEVVAIDALVFHDYKKQFQQYNLYRELNKAFCGFSTKVIENSRTAVCTGNWGCGAFGGDKQLKSLIQVLAASAAKRDVCYFTFEDTYLTDSLYEIHKLLRDNNTEIRDIVSMIKSYGQQLGHGHRLSLFDYIRLQKSSGFNFSDWNEDSQQGCSNSYHDSSQENDWQHQSKYS